MKVGTKSLLFGVHQFLWHPLTVALAWRRRYKKWPTFYESIAIFVHDWGYWGCADMDGPEGKKHPQLGAAIMYRLVFRFARRNEDDRASFFRQACQYRKLVLGHSRSMAKIAGIKISPLCNPDKESVLFDPRWFYLLRATLSGEIHEYKYQAIFSGKLSPSATNREWFDWFKGRVAARAV